MALWYLLMHLTFDVEEDPPKYLKVNVLHMKQKAVEWAFSKVLGVKRADVRRSYHHRMKSPSYRRIVLGEAVMVPANYA